MVELKIQRIGDALGVILPKEVLAQMNRREGETVLIVEGPVPDHMISHAKLHFDKTMAAAEDIMVRYDGALRELAK